MDELKKIAPRLSKIKKEQPFGVPENYFDDFSARLQTRLETEKRDFRPQRGRVIRLLKPAIGLAASFIVIFLLVYLPIRSFLPRYQAQNDLPAMNRFNEEEAQYITFMEKIDENSFFSLLEDAGTEREVTEEDLNDEDLLNYLSANVSDYEIYMENEHLNE